MIRISIFFTLFLVLGLSQKIQAQQSVTVTVENVTSNKGKVGFALFNKENFIKKPLHAVYVKIENGKSTYVFKDISAGEYAVTTFHDKNENGRMDFTSRGMPAEDYGASNNVMNFGPPRFEDAKFTVTDKDVSLSIRF